MKLISAPLRRKNLRDRQLRSLLLAGDLRTVGRVAEVLRVIQGHPKLTSSLLNLLSDSEPGVRMRAADALEKLSRKQIKVLQNFKPALLNLLAQASQKEVRWHLAVLVPRLSLTRPECSYVAEILRGYLKDRSSIVKTFALQGLADLAAQNSALFSEVNALLRSSIESGTPAVRARARKLLRDFE